ncbi:MAG TPA: adenylate/guanylate cyclase domain-containing protein [Chthonomonadaceae bacterium]|nr:adenylate/guanylate cyclase domain-containing protein [Chthonomonadaceae bacterium]
MACHDSNDLDYMSRLLLEDVCSDLVRFLHSKGDPAQFGAVRIDREWALGPPGAFADLRIEPIGGQPYFLEIKYGYDSQTVLAHLRRKYGQLPASTLAEDRVVLVIETAAHADWPVLEAALQQALAPPLRLEVWDEERLHCLMVECFGQTIPAFTGPDLLAIRECIDYGKERLAFGEAPKLPVTTDYSESVLRQNLLWHFGTWRLRELRHVREQEDPRRLVPPGLYEQVVVVMADLSGFSRYMHDTFDDAVVRQILTGFYAKARYQIINAGGMMVQFVGDAVVALFGLPDHRPGYLDDAMRTAVRLLDIGASVSHEWQRRIDHVQARHGVHIGMAMGRIHLVAMRPLDYARLAAIGDCMDIAERLNGLAAPGQIILSNVLRYALRHSAYEFAALEPTEVRNLGTLQPWRLLLQSDAAQAGSLP